MNRQKCLVVVDIQNDFLHENGSLKCPVNDCITQDEFKRRLDVMYNVITSFAKDNYPIVFTRDWHPENSQIFTLQYPEANLPWPKHCVQNSWGAKFIFEDDENFKKILASQNVYVVNKGDNEYREEYSPGYKLKILLDTLNPESIFVIGVASEFCVKATFEDLKQWYPTKPVKIISNAIIPAFEDIKLEPSVEW